MKKCPFCDETTSLYEDLAAHLVVEHELPVRIALTACYMALFADAELAVVKMADGESMLAVKPRLPM